MEEKKGVSLVVYDDNGSLYFLILQRVKDWQGWEFPKTAIEEGQDPEQVALHCLQEQTGLSQYKVIGKLDSKREFEKDGVKYSYDVFIVSSSMNIPVKISNDKYSTYFWGQADRIKEKLSWDSEIETFDHAVEAINANK